MDIMDTSPSSTLSSSRSTPPQSASSSSTTSTSTASTTISRDTFSSKCSTATTKVSSRASTANSVTIQQGQEPLPTPPPPPPQIQMVGEPLTLEQVLSAMTSTSVSSSVGAPANKNKSVTTTKNVSTCSSSSFIMMPQQGTGPPTSELMEWLDKIQLSRPRKHLQRDFSDGVLMAEVISAYFPKLVELHNYVGACGVPGKKHNWQLLNKKVLPKLGIRLHESTVESICTAKPGAIEMVLWRIRKIVDKQEADKHREQEEGSCGDGVDTLEEDVCLVKPILGSKSLPDFVVYRGKKYYPEGELFFLQQSCEELGDKVKDLSSKVRRQETLISLKENHLEDLTRQLHAARVKLGENNHDCICKWKDGESPSEFQTFH